MPIIPHQIEVILRRLYPERYHRGLEYRTAGRNRRRLLIFAVMFSLSALASLAYTFMRPAIYQSTATLLIASSNPIDETGEESNVQHVAIQRQILTSRLLLTKILEKLPEIDRHRDSSQHTLTSLQGMLQVIPVEETNIINLQAEGPQQDFLPILVNTWVDLYLEKNADSQETFSNSAAATLRHRLQGIEQKVAEKRRELEQFRKKYDIVSMERDENQVLARLKGLNNALNKASEDQVVAESRLNTIKDAIAQRKWAGRNKKQTGLERLEQQAEELREQVNDFEQRYTAKFMTFDKNIKAITTKLRRVEEKIRLKYQENQETALAETEENLVSASRAVANLRQQLADYKQKAAAFSARFAEHKSLQEELNQLETLYRDIKKRLVKMDVSNQDEMLQVKVLERAFLPEYPARPHYLRDAGISLAGSLLLGLLAVLLYEFFNRPPKLPAERVSHSILYPQLVPDPRALPRRPAVELLDEQPRPALEHRLPRELSESEVSTLLNAADDYTRLLIGSLLSGLSVEEAAALKWGDVDLESDEIHVRGENPHTIPLAELLKETFAKNVPPQQATEVPVYQDGKGNALPVSELKALISCTAYDAGLVQPSEITPQVLRHTYIAFLVRQGVRLAELEHLIGHFPPAARVAYGIFSPPDPGLSIENIKIFYPALQNQISAEE